MAARPDIGCVTVFGGSGFLGARIVEHLASDGIKVRVAVRNPDKVRLASKQEDNDRIEPVYTDVRDKGSVAQAVEGSDAVVNSVGLYVESGAETFEAVHERGASTLARQCAEQNVASLIHISGIGAVLHSPSRYVSARAKGEALAREAFPETTILRPSVLFGPEDRFINTFAKIIRSAPVIPLFGQGHTRLQAVYVDDVARAVLRALQRPASRGKTYELGGPQAPTYRALIELVMQQTGKRRLLLPIPFFVWDALAAAASLLPGPPLTRDQVILMKEDNVVAETALSLADLDIDATALHDVLPDYEL